MSRHRGYMQRGTWFRFKGRFVAAEGTTLEGQMSFSLLPLVFSAVWMLAVLTVWVAVLVLDTSGRLIPGKETQAISTPPAFLAIGLAIWMLQVRIARRDAAYIEAKVEGILRRGPL